MLSAMSLLRDIGLSGPPRFHRDPLFYLAVVAGALVSFALHFLVEPPLASAPLRQWSTWGAMILLWPVVEELVFRGVMQGELLRTRWGARRWLGLSGANLVTSLIFVALHFLHHPPLWAVSVMVPSLVYGVFRERHASLYPALLLHALYNLGYLLAVTR